MSPTRASAPVRVLYLRAHSRAPNAAYLAGGLQHLRGIEVWQYPAWPPGARGRLDKLPNAQALWGYLQSQPISGPAELKEKLALGFFDMALVSDVDGQLFQYRQANKTARMHAQLGWLARSIRSGWRQGRAEAAYFQALPFTPAELAARLPVAAVDLSDVPFLTPASQQWLEASSVYFKRELPFDRLFLYYGQRPAPWRKRRLDLLSMVAKVQGLPLGIEDEKYVDLKRRRRPEQDIDVLFAGSPTSSLRQAACAHLRRWAAGTTYRVEIHESLAYSDYCDRMARSKVALSVSGGGWDCFRHYEAVALGSIPLMNQPYVDATHWRGAPKEVFFENTFENFESQLEALLADDGLRRRCLAELERRIEAGARHSRMTEAIIAATLGRGPIPRADSVAESPAN